MYPRRRHSDGQCAASAGVGSRARAERLAASRLGVRELSRRTGFAASTISRWLKIDRRPILKHALQAGALDIGRAKLLADLPEAALSELIEIAPRMSRADLAQRTAALRGDHNASTACQMDAPSADSRRLRRALRLLEAVSRPSAADRPTLERLRQVVDAMSAS